MTPRRTPATPLVVLALVLLLTPAETITPPGAARTERTAATSGMGFTVTADSLAIDGLRIEGPGTAPASTTSEPTLNLAADQAIGEKLTIAAEVPDQTMTVSCPARCRLAGQPVRLQIVELTATPVVAGLPLVPITLSAATPAPTLLELIRIPQLTLRDVRGRLALVTADEVETPATRIELLAG